MISSRDDDHIARQLIKLHEQEGNDALDLTCLMRVATLLPDRIELVKEEHARLGPNIVEQLAESGVRLPQVAADQHVVADNEEWQG